MKLVIALIKSCVTLIKDTKEHRMKTYTKYIYQCGYASGNSWNIVREGFDIDFARNALWHAINNEDKYEQERLKNGNYVETGYYRTHEEEE